MNVLCRRARVVFLLVAALVYAASADEARAQGNTGAITGYVFDQAGSPLKGIKVQASSPTQIGGARSTYSNEEGWFRFSQLFPGAFQVQASAPNMKTVLQKNVVVGISASTEVTIIMEVATEQETVSVVERPPIVNTSKPTLTESMSLDFVEQMPYDNRDNIHQQMVNNVPGAIGGRVRGGASNQTVFTQDGFDMRGQYPTLRSSAAYEVSAGGHGADSPTASGGLVNLVTSSGSNKTEFQFSGTFESNKLRFFTDELDRAATTFRYVFNPTISGPLIRDRLWYHVNVESHFLRNQYDKDPEGILPDPPARWQTIQKGTVKLTWQVTPRNKLESLNNFDIVHEHNRKSGLGVDPVAQEDRQGNRWFTGLIWQSLLTDSLVMRLQAGYIAIPYVIKPALCREDPEGCMDVPTVVNKLPRRYEFGNNSRYARDDLYSWQANARLEWATGQGFLGDHVFAFTNRFYMEEDRKGLARPGDRLIEFNGTVPEQQTIFTSNDPRLEAPRYGWLFNTTYVRRNVTTLADEWRPVRGLTISPALSYIFARGSNSAGDSVVGANTFAPSLGAAWDATGDGRTVVRGSANAYVDADVAALAQHTLPAQGQQRCKWNESTLAFDRDCQFSGGRSRNTFGLPCGPTGLDAEGRSCAQSLKIPRTFEYTAGAEREIVQGVALAGDVVYKRFSNQYETDETNRIWNASGTELERIGGYRNGRAETIMNLGTPDDAWRRYVGFTAAVHKREGRLKVQSAYTWSRLEGTVFDGRNNRFGDIPGRDIYLVGALPDDHRHEVKLNATYAFTSWFSTGLRYTYFSGQPYNRLYRNAETGNFEDYRARVGYDPGGNINDPGDDRQLRLPDQQIVFAHARVRFLPLIGQDLDFFVNVTNVLALRTTTAVGQEDGRDFGVSRERMNPFRMNLGISYRY